MSTSTDFQDPAYDEHHDEHAPDPDSRVFVSDADFERLLQQEAAEHDRDEDEARTMLAAVAIGGAVLGVIAIVVALLALSSTLGSGTTTTVTSAATPASTMSNMPDMSGMPGMNQATPAPATKAVAFEKFAPVNPALPAVPPGHIKKFTVGVDQHVVKVAADQPPTEAWTYTVNGKLYKGTAASPPIVVNQGDHVSIKFVNGASKAMNVNMPHSIDFHSAEVAPSKYYVDIAPGKSETINFVAKHPGVFMYHCATQPVLLHVGNGMAGMMVVKPRHLPKVDKELWITQGEYYLGAPGAPADMTKLQAEKPDVIAFNGYANQYKLDPITVRKGEKIRMYVLNTGPSKWSAFHVIGTVFDRAVVEGTVFRDTQTLNLAPSQGAYADFTLDQKGNYPFVTHAFGDMVKGAAGILHTAGAPMPKAPAAAPAPPAESKTAAAAPGHALTSTLSEMKITNSASTVAAGKVKFTVTNSGQTMHELVVLRTPTLAAKLPVNAGLASEAGHVGEVSDLAAGATKTMTLNLKPGHYALICNIAGHYMAGMYSDLTVR